MKKFIRWVIFGCIAIGLIAGILMVPAVQRALFLWVASGEDRSVSVEYLHVGPGWLRIENLEFANDSVLARVPSMEADFSWTALVKRKLVLRDLTAEDLYVRLQEVDPGKEQVDEDQEESDFTVPADFQGILGEVVPVQIQQLSVSGVFSTIENEEIAFSLTGGGLVPGDTGNFSVSIVPGEETKETYPAISLQMPVSVNADGTLQSISLKGEVVSRASTVAGSLQIEGGVQPEDSGESYSIYVRSPELMRGGELAITGAWNEASKALNLGFNAVGEDLEFLQPFVEEDLPPVSFEIDGGTEIKAGQGFHDADLQVHLAAAAGTFPQFDEPLEANGVLKVSQIEEGFSLNEMEVRAGPSIDGEREWLAVNLLEPQTFRKGDSIEIPQGAFARAELYVPERFVDSLTDEWSFSDLVGSVQLEGDGDNLILRSTQPISVAISRSGEENERAVVELTPFLSYGGEQLQFSKSIVVRSSDRELKVDASGDVRIEDLGNVSLKVAAIGNLAALVPVLPDSVQLREGTVNGSWDATVGDEMSVSGALTLEEVSIGENPSFDAKLTIKDSSFVQQPSQEFKLVADVLYRSLGYESSMDDLSVFASANDDGRLKVAVEEGVFVLDLRAFGQEGSEVTQTPAESKPRDLPTPNEVLRMVQFPSLPVDVETISLTGEWLGEDTDYDVSLSASDFIAGSEGSLKLGLSDKASGLSAMMTALVRIDEEAVPDSLRGTINVEGLNMESGPIDLFVDFSYTPSLAVDSLNLNVRSVEGGSPLVSLRGSVNESAVKVSLDSDAVNLLKSPFRTLFPNLATGQFKAEANLSNDGLGVQLAVWSLTPLDGFESYDIAIVGDLLKVDPISIQGQMTLVDQKDKKSDATLVVEGNPDEKLVFQLDGTRIDMEAVERVVAVFGRSGKTEEPAAPGSVADAGQRREDIWPLDALPFSLQGSVTFDEFILPEFPSVRQVDGEMQADRKQALVRLSGSWFEESAFNMQGRISTDGESVEGSIDGRLRDLPVGDFLREMKPKETAALDGTVSVGVSFEGTAKTLADLPNWMAGTLSVNVRDGVIRSLKPEARVTRLVEVGSVAGLIAGSKLNRPGVAALGEVVNMFKEIPFSSFDAQLERSKDRETLIRSVRLLGSYLYLEGSGKVAEGDLEDISTTPMQIDLELGSKAPLTKELDILGLLGTGTNSAGYRKWKKSISITGTFEDPDTSDLWDLVIGAVERAATMSTKDLEKEKENGPQTEEGSEKKKGSTEDLIEQGVNRLFDALKL